MRSIIISLLALIATQASAQYPNQTAPFNLVLLSSNDTINGTALGACHEGAAIEGLCLGGKSPFQFNYTDLQTPDPYFGISGYLTYELRGANFNLLSPMLLSYEPTSNVAVPLFEPREYGTEVAIDPHGRLNIPGSDPADVPLTGTIKPYYRWYACTTAAGYVYETLAWTVGRGQPDNPTCQKVDVIRVFI